MKEMQDIVKELNTALRSSQIDTVDLVLPEMFGEYEVKQTKPVVFYLKDFDMYVMLDKYFKEVSVFESSYYA